MALVCRPFHVLYSSMTCLQCKEEIEDHLFLRFLPLLCFFCLELLLLLLSFFSFSFCLFAFFDLRRQSLLNG